MKPRESGKLDREMLYNLPDTRSSFGSNIGIDMNLGQFHMEEKGSPSSFTQEEIEWARENGAQSVDEIAYYITQHKRLTGEEA